MTDKQAVRSAVKARLNGLTFAVLTENSSAVAERVINNPHYAAARCVFVYLSVAPEIGTAAIVSHALKSGKTVCVPVVDGENMLAVKITDSTRYAKGAFGITEPIFEDKDVVLPSEIDFSVIPLVAFDGDLTRLGKGKGFYDRFLKQTSCYKLGIAHSIQRCDHVPSNGLDVKLDAVITENGVLR